jgi:rod shape determining protein RodA
MNRKTVQHFDYVILAVTIPIVYISYQLVNEIEPLLAQKQLLYIGFSMILFVFIFLYPLRKMLYLVPLFYWLNVALLLLVKFIGVSKLGATRWIEIPFINLSLQPSEMMKPALILMLAYLINREKPPKDGFRLKNFIKLSIYIVIPFLLIAIQPDLGTALTLLLIGYGILFLCGINWKIILSIAIGLAVLLPLGYSSLLHDYQKRRVSQFLQEKPSYQVHQSMIAIGSGGFFGKSKDEATQTQMKFLPIASSDFIFAYYIERFGLFGGVILIGLYIFLIIHLFSYNFIEKEDYFIKVIAIGTAILIFLYMSVNILMTLGLAPVVGIPLPLLSYGGSSFVTFAFIFAIMENLIAFRFSNSN